MPAITTSTYAKEFKKVINATAKGRQIITVQVNFLYVLHFTKYFCKRLVKLIKIKIFYLNIYVYIFLYMKDFADQEYYICLQLYKPEGATLGFSVVGLHDEAKGENGIFVQEVQPNGIADW